MRISVPALAIASLAFVTAPACDGSGGGDATPSYCSNGASAFCNDAGMPNTSFTDKVGCEGAGHVWMAPFLLTWSPSSVTVS